MIGSFGWQELILILLIVLLLFGAKKLPEVARSVGKALGEFKKGMKETKKELDEEEEKKDEDTGG